METPKKSKAKATEAPGGGNARPLETPGKPPRNSASESTVRPFGASFEDLPRIRESDPEVRPFAVRFEDLPVLRDSGTDVRPFDVTFEDLPRAKDLATGVRPFEARIESDTDSGAESGAEAFGRPDRA